MKHFLFTLSLSLAVLAMSSVSYSAPPATHALPKTNEIHAAPAVLYSTPVYLEYRVGGPDVHHLDIAMPDSWEMFLVPVTHSAAYIQRYPFRDKSLLNYWPGYWRIV